MPTFLVFAGTSEGRRMVEWLSRCGAEVCASVATEYGKSLLPDGVKVFSERLDESGMTTLLGSLRFDCVIDATHPYAAAATANIKAACVASSTRYLRLCRPDDAVAEDGYIFASDARHAARMLSATTGNVLLTTGSKELDIFTLVEDFSERIYPRVLPTVESIERCLSLGYKVSNIIAMQGPFSRELNGATLRQIGAKLLVTKASGEAGGFAEKLSAARDAGAIAVVIGRPPEQQGLTFDEAASRLCEDFKLNLPVDKAVERSLLNIQIDLTGKRAIIFGGAAVGRFAGRLSPFCGAVTAVTTHSAQELEAYGVQVIRRQYMSGDCAGYDLVIAAYDNREINLAVAREAHERKIPISIADCAGESNFFLPENA